MYNKKYYIPTQQDLFEGFEYEAQYYNEDTDEYEDKWEKHVFDTRDGLGHDLTHQFSEGTVRCETLTKEYLESKGWFYRGRISSTEDDSLYSNVFNKNNPSGFITLYMNQDNHVSISEWDNIRDIKTQTLFRGYIPTPNHLRLIFKILNIK